MGHIRSHIAHFLIVICMGSAAATDRQTDQQPDIDSDPEECSISALPRPTGQVLLQTKSGRGTLGGVNTIVSAAKKDCKDISGLGCSCDRGICYLYGDPHFRTFDGEFTAFYGKQMNFWVVHSKSVKIQGRALSRRSKMDGLAFGGPWMKGHTLVQTESDSWLFDGKRILTKDGDSFNVAGVCELSRHSPKSLLPSDEDLDELTGKGHLRDVRGRWQSPKGSMYHFKLPLGVELFMTWKMEMEVLLKMPAQANQAGYCGNFNGNIEDDGEGTGHGGQRESAGSMLDPIPAAEDLFKTVGLVSITGMVQERSLNFTCDEELKKKAETACKHIPEEGVRQGCVVDVCLTKDLKAAGAEDEMEVLAVKEGKGSVEFEGHGRCLDQDKNTFSVLEAKDTADRQSCIKLGHVAGHKVREGVKGIRGIQFEENGPKCQILFDGANPHDKLPGLWDITGSLAQQGKGIVASADGTAGWYCWQIL